MSTTETTEKNVWADVEKSYKILDLIGQGAYGTVKKAKNIVNGNLVAIKHITNFSHSKILTLKVLREILIMKGL
jgi:serine/threonine protein kinase